MKHLRGIRALLPAALLAAFSPAVHAEAPPPQLSAPRPLGWATSPEEVGFDRTRLKRLDDYVAKSISDGKFSGASILLARHGKIVAFNTYGRKSLGGSRWRATRSSGSIR